jgi:hypothetical protein
MSISSSNTSELLEAIKKLSNEERTELIETLNKPEPEPEPELSETDKLRQELFNTQSELACLKNRIDRMENRNAVAQINTFTMEEPESVEFESCCPFSFDITSFIKWVMIIILVISIIQSIIKITKTSNITGSAFRPYTIPI